MPTYKASATLFELNTDTFTYDITNGTFAVRFDNSRFSYDVLQHQGGSIPAIEVGGSVTPHAMSFDGRAIMENGMRVTDVALGDLHWGAGRETRVMSLTMTDFVFDDIDQDFDFDFEGMQFQMVVIPISGDVMPDLTRGGFGPLDEMGVLVDMTADAQISEGPMAAGRSFDTALLFADDTSGLLRQGGDGGDRLMGKRSDDLLVGAQGNDLLKGKGGADTMMAGAGHDKLLGGNGHDALSGWFGRDRLLGQGGDDTMFGGAGNDRLVGGRGDDLLSGDGGADAFVFGKRHGDDTISDFDTTEDRLVLDDRLWRGTRDAEAVVDRFAESTDAGTLLDFGRKGSVLLEDVWIDGRADRAALIEAIDIA
ncbi:calcium-binding protein [Limimaricola hongkongensis]|uniref:Hemolysin-type calcium-binding region n=1 Tax=Limimaricola hongkongensis DSM 17492 TaxID=1122180 RepID=A0A017H885_9RHOB|nr:calcium-binding protein [Limimaricola hongkongensis]EYD70561.1 Hemolysin-type calcium-binding region [Limimaricola hongkongensis DSM 17492]